MANASELFRLEEERNLDWDRWFLGLAQYVSTRSKDPSTKVGAVVVGDNHLVVGIGYNGFPRGVADTEERLNDREQKYPRVVHAEANAILRAGALCQGSTLYVYPAFISPPTCNECAKLVIQSGIREVVGFEPDLTDERVARWKSQLRIAGEMYDEAGVTYRTVKP